MNDSVVYALDFDGVICDSALETGQSGWKAARRIWPDMPETIPEEKNRQFHQIRPIIETGYEAILAMRMLHLGASVESIYSGHGASFQSLMEQAQVTVDELKKLFGDTRDTWIANDRTEWVERNPLYVNMADRLAQLGKTKPWYIITTKQERFVKMILQANRIDLPDDRIFGLDRKLSKAEVLRMLRNHHPGQPIHFFEDRVQTLLKIEQDPELQDVRLFFAPWGYNTAEDKALAASRGFASCTLEAFLT